MKTFLKRLFGLGALTAVGYAAWRAYDRRKIDTGVTWDPQPFPYPPQPHNATPTPSSEAPNPELSWQEADDGSCPASHPVKAKLASGIFHVPGGANYDRTKADRCYISAEAAQSDGLRAAKR
jgi:hypothetical protein